MEVVQASRPAILALLLSVAPAGAQDWAKADLAVRRLAPSAFPELPTAVQRELNRRGCTIPQSLSGTHENVVKGQFTSAKQTDWAVLCSVKRRSSILVFRDGSSASIAQLAPAPDADFLQVISDGAIGYSRGIGVAKADVIRLHYQVYGGAKPPPLDHDGIDDAFNEKGSAVWYWYRGRWRQLTGSN
jgi:hypothetical protein